MLHLRAAPPVDAVGRPTFKLEFRREMGWLQAEAGPYRLSANMVLPKGKKPRVERTGPSSIRVGSLCIVIHRRDLKPSEQQSKRRRHLAPVRTGEPVMR